MMGGQSAYVLLAPTLPTLNSVQGKYARASGKEVVQKVTTVRMLTWSKVG